MAKGGAGDGEQPLELLEGDLFTDEVKMSAECDDEDLTLSVGVFFPTHWRFWRPRSVIAGV